LLTTQFLIQIYMSSSSLTFSNYESGGALGASGAGVSAYGDNQVAGANGGIEVHPATCQTGGRRRRKSRKSRGKSRKSRKSRKGRRHR